MLYYTTDMKMESCTAGQWNWMMSKENSTWEKSQRTYMLTENSGQQGLLTDEKVLNDVLELERIYGVSC